MYINYHRNNLYRKFFPLPAFFKGKLILDCHLLIKKKSKALFEAPLSYTKTYTTLLLKAALIFLTLHTGNQNFQSCFNKVGNPGVGVSFRQILKFHFYNLQTALILQKIFFPCYQQGKKLKHSQSMCIAEQSATTQ